MTVRLLVQDGTYINSPYLLLNGSGNVANVPLTIGILHDEAGALIPYPSSTNLSQEIENAGLPSQLYTDNSALFPEPSGTIVTLDIFNVTVHMATDGELRCLNEAIAYAGVQNNIFKSVWFYEYTRSYQPADFDVNVPVCQAPIDAARPYGDTSKPYFRYVNFGLSLVTSPKSHRNNLTEFYPGATAETCITHSVTSFAKASLSGMVLISYSPNISRICIHHLPAPTTPILRLSFSWQGTT